MLKASCTLANILCIGRIYTKSNESFPYAVRFILFDIKFMIISFTYVDHAIGIPPLNVEDVHLELILHGPCNFSRAHFTVPTRAVALKPTKYMVQGAPPDDGLVGRGLFHGRMIYPRGFFPGSHLSTLGLCHLEHFASPIKRIKRSTSTINIIR